MKHLLCILFLFTSLLSLAQKGEIKGTVKDAQSSETLIGASVTYASGKGAITDVNGNYSIKTDSGEYTITVSMVGYEPFTQKVKTAKSPVVLDVLLKLKTLDEIEIVADVAKSRETPIAFSNISTKQIQEELGTKDLPMILNTTPGAYATEKGGGSGDSRVNMRGFDQTNIAVMVDGVPVNDMENGAVYWSNWDGLSDITRTMQVQRGLGASKLAIASVGGTINIITQGIDGKMSASIKQEVNDFGLYKTSFGFNSGQMKGGWGITLAGSRKWGSEWADGTFTDAWSYFAKIQKRFKKHLLSISVNGAPQKHGMRSDRLAIAVYNRAFAESLGITDKPVERGLKYNSGIGMLDGKTYNGNVNYFHKPAFNLSHFWTPNDKFTLSTIAYLSLGNGGGTAFKNTPARDSASGLLNVQTDFDNNYYAQPDVNYGTTESSSTNFVRASINKHIWYGVLSSIDYKMKNTVKILFGIDLRSYKGIHYQTPYDLLGGDFAVDFSDKNQATPSYAGDPNWKLRMKRQGDMIAYHNENKVMWGGLFAQVEYKKNKWSVFATVSASETAYKRFDYFKKRDLIFENNSYAQIVGYGDVVYYNGSSYLFAGNGTAANNVTVHGDTTFVGSKYILNAKKYTGNSPESRVSTTDKKMYLGYTIKAGANYNINEHHNVFINLGYLNMAPLMNTVFDINNREYANINNQHVYAIEGGYGFKDKKVVANINLYYTVWQNKPSSGSIPAGGQTYYYNILGLDALHKGIEMDLFYKVIKNVEVEALASLGDWKNTSGAMVDVTDENGALVKRIDFSAVNVHVGDAAQTQLGGGVRYSFLKGFYIKPRYTYFARHYAYFNPTDLTGDSKDHDAWKMPAYGLLDLFAGYNFDYRKMKFSITAGVSNLLNAVYITDGLSGSTFEANSTVVYMGMGRRFNVGLKVGF